MPLAFWCYCNRASQAQRFNSNSGGQSLKSRGPRGCCLLRAMREGAVPGLSPRLADSFPLSMTVSVSKYHVHLNTAVILCEGSTLLQCDLILISDICNDPIAR